jgi:hypothetical protein
MEYSQTVGNIRIVQGSDSARDAVISSPTKKIYIAPTSERVCTIRTRDGRESVHRGADAPSVNAVLLFFKRRKLKALQERTRSPLDRKRRMARDLLQRFGECGVLANPSIASAPLHWWERAGTLRGTP